MRALALSLFAVAAVACGSDKKEPSTPSATNSEIATATPSQAPTAPAAPEPPAKKRKPYEIVNLCPKVVNLLFGDDPKAPGTGSRMLGGNGRIDDGPRDNDGNQIVWLIVRDEPLVKVRVSRATKRIEVGTSCDTLEMH